MHTSSLEFFPSVKHAVSAENSLYTQAKELYTQYKSMYDELSGCHEYSATHGLGKTVHLATLSFNFKVLIQTFLV